MIPHFTHPGRRDRHLHMDCKFHMTEIFCGRGAIAKSFRELGYNAAEYDVRIHDDFNIHTPKGVMLACEFLVCTKPDGLAVLEPTCSSWGWVNLGTSLRSVVPGLG